MLLILQELSSHYKMAPDMLMFSSRLMPPINTRCNLGEFAPRVNQTLINVIATVILVSDVCLKTGV